MTPPERDYARYRLGRAREALAVAARCAADEQWGSCVNRLYYACFYAINAVLYARGEAASKHTHVRSIFNRTLVLPGHLAPEHGVMFNALFEARQQSDYEDFGVPDPEQVRTWCALVPGFIGALESLIAGELNGDRGESGEPES